MLTGWTARLEAERLPSQHNLSHNSHFPMPHPSHTQPSRLDHHTHCTGWVGSRVMSGGLNVGTSAESPSA